MVTFDEIVKYLSGQIAIGALTIEAAAFIADRKDYLDEIGSHLAEQKKSMKFVTSVFGEIGAGLTDEDLFDVPEI